MPDNWGFVLAAYGLAAGVLLAYWRFLARRERDLRGAAEQNRIAPVSGHPGPEPASRTPRA